MSTLQFNGHDLRWLFEILVEAVEITSREKVRPDVIVNGKRYKEFDLLKVALLLPDEELQPHHQAVADEMFKRRQRGYRMTAVNLAHRANQIASDAARLRAHHAMMKEARP